MATVSCLAGTSVQNRGPSTPLSIRSHSRSRAERTSESSLVSSSPPGAYFDFGRSPLSSLPRTSFDSSKRTSTGSTSNAPRSATIGFVSPSSAAAPSLLKEGKSSSGLLSEQLRIGRSSDAHSPEALLKAQLTAALSNERVSSFSGSPDWVAARLREPVLSSPRVQRAYAMAATAHAGQLRKDGTPVMRHLEETAIILADLGLDAAVIAAALLHDSLDDSAMTRELLRYFLPDDDGVVELVADVTKVSMISQLFRSERSLEDDESTAEKLRGMILALGDVRVVLIKLADRLHNMRTLDALSPAKRASMAAETEALFVPLANRLGVWPLKAELEDLCFKARSPEGFKELEAQVDALKASQKESIDTFLTDAHSQLKSLNVPVLEIAGRAKNMASIFKKLQRKGSSDTDAQTLEDIHDVRGVRIIVQTKQQCYDALRAITARWPTVDGRHKNYIRHPKANGYQSLHTVVISDDGQPFEVQIRTDKMHWVAEYGIAAHWRYKEQGIACSALENQRVMWSRLVLTFFHHVNDKKCRLQGSPGRETFMHHIGAGVLAAHGKSPSDIPSTLPAATTSFERYASTFAVAPAAPEAVAIVVTTPDASSIRTFSGSFATVRDALKWFPAGTRVDDLLVNGERLSSASGFVPLSTCDVVTLAPPELRDLRLPVVMPRLPPWPLLRGTSTGTCRAVLSRVMTHLTQEGAFLAPSGALPPRQRTQTAQ